MAQTTNKSSLSAMHTNPYKAPAQEAGPPRPAYRSRLGAAAHGALDGAHFVAKWTVLIAGPLLGLSAVAVICLALLRWWTRGGSTDDLVLLALNLMLFLAVGIAQLFTWMVAFSIVGATVNAIRQAICFKRELKAGS